MKKKHHCRPGSKRFAECQTAALQICERLDHERPTELEIWGCGPCPEYPDGLIGLAEIDRTRGN